MPIYTTLSLKGGVGKTTTALHLAAVAVTEGKPVTVLDTDAEQSAIRWASHGALPFEVHPADRRGLPQQVAELAKDKRRVIIIDTPPNDRATLNRAAELANVAVVPVLATGLDVDRLGPTLELLGALQAQRKGLDVAILLTRWDSRQILAQETVDALAGFPVLKTKIRSLARYAQAFGAAPSYLDEYKAAWKELRA